MNDDDNPIDIFNSISMLEQKESEIFFKEETTNVVYKDDDFDKSENPYIGQASNIAYDLGYMRELTQNYSQRFKTAQSKKLSNEIMNICDNVDKNIAAFEYIPLKDLEQIRNDVFSKFMKLNIKKPPRINNNMNF